MNADTYKLVWTCNPEIAAISAVWYLGLFLDLTIESWDDSFLMPDEEAISKTGRAVHELANYLLQVRLGVIKKEQIEREKKATQ